MAPMSANKAYRVFRGRSIKSKEYREFELAVNHYMAAHFEQCAIFMQNLDINQHALAVKYEFYFPYDDIMTKSGRVKMRGSDLDNCVKHIQDNLFKFLNVDDGIVCEITAHKIPSYANWTVITLERINIPEKKEIPDLPTWSQIDH